MSGNGKVFILSAGGEGKDESRFAAVSRELAEETTLTPCSAQIIFRHSGKVKPTMSWRGCYHDHHQART